MSATNRGSERIEADFYPTPKEAFEPLLVWLKSEGGSFWEPSCGDGRLINWMREFGLKADGNDLNNGYDYLQDETFHMNIVSNPPFIKAFEFCQHAVSHAEKVFMLLRINFLASRERREWFRKNEPSALFILSKRPSFIWTYKCTGCGYKWIVENGNVQKICPTCGWKKLRKTTSDSVDYAWFAWGTDTEGIIHL